MITITKAHLERQVGILNRMTSGGYLLGWANGGVRLEADAGARDISPRGTKRELSAQLATAIQVLSRESDDVIKITKAHLDRQVGILK